MTGLSRMKSFNDLDEIIFPSGVEGILASKVCNMNVLNDHDEFFSFSSLKWFLHFCQIKNHHL